MEKRTKKNYKQIVEKVYDTAKEGNMDWPDWMLDAIESSVHRNFFIDVPVGSGGYYHFIKLLVKEIQPKIVLELGSCSGLGVLSVMHTLPESSNFITIDIARQLQFVPEKILSDERFRFVLGNCLSLKSYGENIPTGIDLLICDTIHNYEQIKAEVETYEPYLADQAIILIDDLDFRASKKKRVYFDEWDGDKVDLSGYCHVSGYGALIYERK